jgi:hypothetical protein
MREGAWESPSTELLVAAGNDIASVRGRIRHLACVEEALPALPD